MNCLQTVNKNDSLHLFLNQKIQMSIIHSLTCDCNEGFEYASYATFEKHFVSQRHRHYEMRQSYYTLRIKVRQQEQHLIQKKKMVHDLQNEIEHNRETMAQQFRNLDMLDNRIKDQNETIDALQRQNRTLDNVAIRMHHALWKSVMNELLRSRRKKPYPSLCLVMIVMIVMNALDSISIILVLAATAADIARMH